MLACNRMFSSVLKISVRHIRHNVQPKDYPQVNVKDVVLNPPRYGFRKTLEPLLSQSVTDVLLPKEVIRQKYIDAGKVIPNKYLTKSDTIARRNLINLKEKIEMGLPHFMVGKKKVYFPKGRICLLRPNAKHTPYQAKFLVPKSMNRLDLRDYLWHVYGLRALNVTVQLLHSKWQRGQHDHGRHRGPQLKKMTVDMEEPFIWPEVPEKIVKYGEEQRDVQLELGKPKHGSDKKKPLDVNDGLYKGDPFPNAFVPAKLRRSGAKELKQYNEQVAAQPERDLVSKYLGL
ncbi:54S ribosomal protein L41 mitochondrial [Spathaspora sp. JA1]|nr:54S ribosomal protein L41 mitochondrial [Spathaspora sp. JA1]